MFLFVCTRLWVYMYIYLEVVGKSLSSPWAPSRVQFTQYINLKLCLPIENEKLPTAEVEKNTDLGGTTTSLIGTLRF